MIDNYAKIVQDNLARLYAHMPEDLAENLPGEQDGERFVFDAFGQRCQVTPRGIDLKGGEYSSVFGILISLYALNACPAIPVLLPFKAFKEFPDSMPYAGAFVTHTRQILVHHVEGIDKSRERILEKLNGHKAPAGVEGDFSFVVFPLPKIALCYIFYEADDDFSASATCLFSNNALSFLPIDALADVGEYTSKKILHLVQEK